MYKIQNTMGSVMPFVIKVGSTLLFTLLHSCQKDSSCGQDYSSKVLLRLITDVVIGYSIMSYKQILDTLL